MRCGKRAELSGRRLCLVAFLVSICFDLSAPIYTPFAPSTVLHARPKGYRRVIIRDVDLEAMVFHADRTITRPRESGPCGLRVEPRNRLACAYGDLLPSLSSPIFGMDYDEQVLDIAYVEYDQAPRFFVKPRH